METEQRCDLCGGTDFYDQEGFLVCQECQTLSQQIRQDQYHSTNQNEEANDVVAEVTVKRTKAKRKPQQEFTTWECCNRVLLGLVNEIITLGASNKLKKVIKCLWFKYLDKCSVTGNTSVPKLSIPFNEKDAEIIYRIPAKRKRKRSNSSSSAASSVSSSWQKKSEVKTFHNISQQEILEKQSLSQSLTTLHSSDDEGTSKKSDMQFNTYAKKAVQKIMSEEHFQEHMSDEQDDMTCHQFKRSEFSESYLRGPAVLTRSRLYSILYLGLLIVKDKVQLGDMLRFIREGHLSYICYEHFFPEDLLGGSVTYLRRFCESSQLPTHRSLRKGASDMAKFLDVCEYICTPDLVLLCKRYVEELNLPDEIANCCTNLIMEAIPRMPFTSTSRLIPNYEGRTMSLVVFTLKMLFGLDDVTEHEFSRFAESINDKSNDQEENVCEMFIFNNWLRYLEYRRHVLQHFHFPTQCQSKDMIKLNPELYVAFLKHQQEKCRVVENVLHRDQLTLRKCLEVLLSRELFTEDCLHFPESYTPFLDYSKRIAEVVEEKGLMPLIGANFHNKSIDYVLKPFKYFPVAFDGHVKVQHKGANKNITVIKMPQQQNEARRSMTKLKRLVTVIIGNETSKDTSNLDSQLRNESKEETNTKIFLKNFRQKYKNRFKETNYKMCQISSQNIEELGKCEIESDYVHYNSFERYWLALMDVRLDISMAPFLEFFNDFPKSFITIFEEGSRVTEQSLKELFEEFVRVELFMIYEKSGEENCDKDLKFLVKDAKQKW